MTYNQWIELFFDRSNAYQWYWTLYVVIAGGLLAFSSLRQRGDLITTILITLLFSFFAYKNADALHDTTLQRHAALNAIKTFPAGSGEVPPPAHRERLEASLIVLQWPEIRNFHLTSDLLVVACLWAFELRRRRAALPATVSTAHPAANT
jgi:hypothetical protein